MYHPFCCLLVPYPSRTLLVRESPFDRSAALVVTPSCDAHWSRAANWTHPEHAVVHMFHDSLWGGEWGGGKSLQGRMEAFTLFSFNTDKRAASNSSLISTLLTAE